jgi:hypothetical protein
MAYAKRFWREESGVVESALVIIPLLVLFLISIQLIIAVNMRNIDLAEAQGRATSVAIGTEQGDADQIVSFFTTGSRGDLRMVVSHQGRRIPDLFSGLISFMHLSIRSTEVSGIAVMENGP